jgi:integrase
MKLEEPLTEAIVSKLKIPRGKTDETWFDSKIKGFGVRKRGDVVTFVLQYQSNGRTAKLKLGKWPEIKCEVARGLALAKRGQIEKAKLGLGVDPAIERAEIKAEAQKPKPQTLGATIAAYLEAVRGKISHRYDVALTYHLEVLLKSLHGLSLSDVSRAAVAAEIRIIANERGGATANRARGSLSAFFRWAIGEGLCDNNPVVGTNQHEENGPRERSLSDAEAAKVFLACPDNDYGRIVQLLLLTGCRREEIGSLEWSEIDLDARAITLPPTRTKNGQEHIVPLSDAALAILRSIPPRDRVHVFGIGTGGYAGWSKGKTNIDKVAKLKTPWTVHDLRRTVRTGLGMLGVLPHVAEAVLNHLPAKLIRTYDRNTYAAEKKAALDAWANHLEATISPTGKAVAVRAIPVEGAEADSPRAPFAKRLAGAGRQSRLHR